jgi:hypothetical protein
MKKTIIIIMLIFFNLSLYVNNLDAKSKAKSHITKNKKIVNKKQNIKKKPSKKSSLSKKRTPKKQVAKKVASKKTINKPKVVNKKQPAIVKKKTLNKPIPPKASKPPVQNVQPAPSQTPIKTQEQADIKEQASQITPPNRTKVESKYNMGNKTSDIIKMKKEDVYVDKSISSGEIGQAKTINRKTYGFIDE